MGNYLASAFMVFLTIALICILAAIFLRISECIWVCLYAIISPFTCPNRRRLPWIIECCNCTILLCEYTATHCGICCLNINERIKKYKEKINKRFQVQPIIYDDVHVIVVNPNGHRNQIATKSTVLNV